MRAKLSLTILITTLLVCAQLASAQEPPPEPDADDKEDRLKRQKLLSNKVLAVRGILLMTHPLRHCRVKLAPYKSNWRSTSQPPPRCFWPRRMLPDRPPPLPINRSST